MMILQRGLLNNAAFIPGTRHRGSIIAQGINHDRVSTFLQRVGCGEAQCPQDAVKNRQPRGCLFFICKKSNIKPVYFQLRQKKRAFTGKGAAGPTSKAQMASAEQRKRGEFPALQTKKGDKRKKEMLCAEMTRFCAHPYRSAHSV